MLKQKVKRFLHLSVALVVVAVIGLELAPPKQASAAIQITNRSLTLEPGTIDGGSKPSGSVKHLFTFNLSDTTDSVGSISFQYCTTAAPVPGGVGCVMPAGLDLTGVNLNAQNGVTGFTTTTKSSQCDDNPTTCTNLNTITIGRTPAATISAGQVSYEFTGIVNPSTPNTTFFVRISTFTSTDGTGTALESGTVAASTTNLIDLSGTMPESLVFCTGHTITINTSDVPDCTTATSGAISFNQLFSPSSTSWATSQMAASTNAGSGYVITVNGPTMTSGSNTITAIGATAAASQLDTRQFGLNLVDDTADTTLASSSPALTYFDAHGGSVYPASDGTDFFAQPASTTKYPSSFDTASSYAFVPGSNNIVAASDWSAGGSTGTPGPSNTQRYTATYIVNVSGNQPAGTYNTTLTYVCTPTF